MAVEDDIPPESRPIFLRGYVVREKKSGQGAFDSELEEVDPVPPSEWSLTFDCETHTDAAQSLRFGAYQLRKNGVLAKNGLGLFHADDIGAGDLEVLKAVAAETGARLLDVRAFVNWVLFDRVYTTGGTVIGFNLPFDISRLALSHGSARNSMRGGFSFSLSTNNDWPRLRVKHISSRIAFIRYGAPPKKRTPEGQRKRGLVVPPRRGSFVDVKTFALALLSEGHSLLTLSRDVLKVEHPKSDVDEHGGPLTPDYVAYGMRDVQATWECYAALKSKFDSYEITTVEPKSLYSEASLGKAYLRQMGVRPWREVQPDFPPEIIGELMSTYYGGRAEVHIRREKREVLYCDFLSMYPTVCTLMGLWRFVIANGMTWRDATIETQALLNRIKPAELMSKGSWSELTTLVQLRPDETILPVRTRYGDEPSSTIGVNALSGDGPLWFTLADVLAAKVLSGLAPTIEKAVRFEAADLQDGLEPINIAGNPNYTVEPGTTDFYRRVIDLRQTVKAKRDAAAGDDRARLDSEQLALKILANATSYGIFIQMIVQDLDKAETLPCYGADGRSFPAYTKKYEEPGPFFHPLLGTLITGAARLMLALAERRTADEGLDWVFCDTDSIAIAKPHDMDRGSFVAATERARSAFTDLNPYEAQAGSILQLEEQNFAKGDKAKSDLKSAPPLFCYAISAKRYCLYNHGDDGAPIVRKASAHGLGHLLPPYEDPDKARRSDRLKEVKVDLWQEDLWKRIIVAAENGEATEGGAVIGLDGDDRLGKPVASRYGATTPALLGWFKDYNRRRSYTEQVRPFGFLLSLQSKKMEQIAHHDDEARAWWSKFKSDPSPAAPFDRDPGVAADQAFDRHRRDRKVPRRWLVSYARALSDYHLQPETKFRGGGVRRGSGALTRRAIRVGAVQHIGKEADRWDEQLHTGEDDADILYGLTPEGREDLVATIRAARKRFSFKRYAEAAKVSDRTIANALAETPLVSDAMLMHLAEVGGRFLAGYANQNSKEIELLEWALEEAAMAGGVYVFAAKHGMDGSNLSKALRQKGRQASPAMLDRLRAIRAAEHVEDGPSVPGS